MLPATQLICQLLSQLQLKHIILKVSKHCKIRFISRIVWLVAYLTEHGLHKLVVYRGVDELPHRCLLRLCHIAQSVVFHTVIERRVNSTQLSVQSLRIGNQYPGLD